MTDKKTYKPYPDSGSLRASATKKSPKSPDYWGNIAINLSDTTNVRTEDGLTMSRSTAGRRLMPAARHSCPWLWIALCPTVSHRLAPLHRTICLTTTSLSDQKYKGEKYV
jgi:hypothetical protein